MKFIHFGCWNENGCNINRLNSPLSFVMRSLNDYIDRHKIRFIVIAGDNYYEDRNNKNKFNKNNFYSGFQCLPIHIKKYLIFGNHDLMDKFNVNNKYNECLSINLQYLYASKNKSFKLFSDVLHKIYKNTLIIMIDSTLFWNISNLYLPCYQKLFPNIKLTTIDALRIYQLNSVINILKNNLSVSNIIFIAHHPIIAFITENEKRIKIINNKIVDFFNNINSYLQHKNIYYLCADTHLYQYGIININGLIINQYISGTGGARPDYFTNTNLKYTSEILSYEVIQNINKFGYLVVQIKDKIKFKFIIV